MNEFWTEFFRMFLGDVLTPVVLTAGFAMSLLGLYMRWFFSTVHAVKHNPETPDKFSFLYSLKKNWFKKLATGIAILIVIFVSFRFPVELIGVSFSMFYAFAVGLCLDWIIGRIFKIYKSKNPIKT